MTVDELMQKLAKFQGNKKIVIIDALFSEIHEFIEFDQLFEDDGERIVISCF